MKELSIEEKVKRAIEEKAKAYDEALERARKELQICGSSDCDAARQIFRFFPELKESEDERIRKELIFYLGDMPEDTELRNGVTNRDVLAWLEKQGEQKTSDKVEPKFNLYDWVVTDKGDTVQIGAVNNGYYTLFNVMDFNMSYVDKCWHKWTIEDAKEGDVLSYVTDEEDLWIMIYWSLYKPYKGHVHYHALLANGDFTDKGTCCIDINYLKPATKEQRDQLEKAMANAGYKWNKEERKLEKI